MPRKFIQLAFTPAVKAAQAQRGSRQTYARFEQNGPENDTITPDIAEFIAQMDGFYLGTVSSNGYPYIQFRGGQPGFLKVLDDKTLGFADFKGNAQYVTVGNLSENDKAFLFLMDYRHRKRLKIWGRARYVEDNSQIIAQLAVPNYEAEIERVMMFQVEAWNWNCPQHIPIRYSEQEVAALQARITELEKLLAGK
ncbi:pyridoxamine 5'-phosphate oxidase family protein [Calothrix sp. PCC 7507]|uniref:pyridoxamine 5'-phosphate oxidase family protein n=1 Tax=Calothrix sp. PCC 7507 TaxID=99598 RepID=UPI00029F44D9|nr:pyridoxamine 5'-phosphate oxidase family protein [Calothrix sp. PCC 7507]AFY30736.1 pyridoxamine 5'-phosphate oxidase-related FMN-binding protein [Calothrix sp. PCC 7507]